MRSSPHITIIILAIDPKGAPILSFPRPPPAPPSPHIMAPPETTVTTRRGPKTGTWHPVDHRLHPSLLHPRRQRKQIPRRGRRRRLVPFPDDVPPRPSASRHRVQRRRLRRWHGASAWHHPNDGLPHTLEHLVFLGILSVRASAEIGGRRAHHGSPGGRVRRFREQVEERHLVHVGGLHAFRHEVRRRVHGEVERPASWTSPATSMIHKDSRTRRPW